MVFLPLFSFIYFSRFISFLDFLPIFRNVALSDTVEIIYILSRHAGQQIEIEVKGKSQVRDNPRVMYGIQWMKYRFNDARRTTSKTGSKNMNEIQQRKKKKNERNHKTDKYGVTVSMLANIRCCEK